MAQWRQLLKLDPGLKSRVSRLYERRFPLDVRRCLSDWIESQDWGLAAADEATARTCFQTLLLKLDELIKESLYNNNTLLGPDFSLPKDYLLNAFERHPLDMAVILSDCLKGEKMILDSCTVNQHCSSTVTEQNQADLDNKVGDVENQIKKTEEEIKTLEKLELIYKTWASQVEQMNGLATPQMQQQCLNQANFIRTKTQEVFGEMVKSVNLASEIIQTLISVELPEWKRRQQMSCIGNPVSTSLDHLEKWFTTVAEMLLQIRQQLKKLQEQSSRHQISDVSNLSGVIQQIDTFTKSLLIKLMENALVVEKQPVMFNQTHRPLVLKTGVLFTLKLRFLANLSSLKYGCLVRAEFDKDIEEVKSIKGFRQFEFTTNNTKVLDVDKQKGGLVAKWDMSIKEVKTKNKRSNESPIRVTEELHIIKFSTDLQFADLQCQVENSSLPVVVVSSTSQTPSAWATVMWYNLLSSTEPRSLSVFMEPPPLSWEQLSQALSWQFISAGDRELNEDQLSELKLKIVDDPDELVSWSKFSHQKEGPWIWIEGILDLIEKHLKELWRDGSIMGFVNKEKARVLLQSKQNGNFLLRFSESNREGAITFSWVEHRTQESIVHAIEPFTKDELSKMSLADHINQYRLKKSPTNPLVYLYPDVPKDNAFGRYYKTCDTPEITKPPFPYVQRTYVCEGNCPTPPPSPPKNTELDMDLDFPDLPTPQTEQSLEELTKELFPGVLSYNSECFDMDLCDILYGSNTT